MMASQWLNCYSLLVAITVSIKPASSSIPLVKRVRLDFEDGTPRPGAVECLSDPSPAKVCNNNQSCDLCVSYPVMVNNHVTLM